MFQQKQQPTDGHVVTIDYKKQIQEILKQCNKAKEETRIYSRRLYEFQNSQKFLVKNGIKYIQ